MNAVGIVCTIALGLIALHQTWAARNYRTAALLSKQSLAAHEVKARAVAEAIGQAHEAAVRGDIHELINALRMATAAAAAGEPLRMGGVR